jgi:hypothetical protein
MKTLSEFREALGTLKATFTTPEAACVDLLLSRVSAWRKDDTTVESLIGDLGRLVNELGFSSHSGRAKVALAIAELHDTIEAVGGMTMNERLVSFDLFDRWDRASDAERAVLYGKVLARP